MSLDVSPVKILKYTAARLCTMKIQDMADSGEIDLDPISQMERLHQ